MRLVKFVSVILIALVCDYSYALGLVGKSVPEIAVSQWITQNPPKAEDLAGSVWVVEFWATWCPPCVANVGHLNKLNDKYGKMGLEILALSQDNSADTVSKFVRKKGINYNVAMDRGSADFFGVTGYPTVYVVNHLGKVVWEGYPWDENFEKAISKAVNKCPPPLLRGVDLGPFKNLKRALFGGKDFAKTYRKIKAQVDNPKNAKTAKVIVNTIDRSIRQKTQTADQLRETNPQKAYSIYGSLVSRYDGIEVVMPAKNAYFEMKNR